jgi:hypothetical protein
VGVDVSIGGNGVCVGWGVNVGRVGRIRVDAGKGCSDGAQANSPVRSENNKIVNFVA